MEKVNSGLVQRYEEIRARIDAACLKSHRDPGSVRLIAVSKTRPFEEIAALYQIGQRDFGENYAQELVEKAKQAQALGLHEIRWHMIGHLQSNKVKAILPYVSVIHTVDSEKLLSEIQKRATQPVEVLIEVNLDGETSKAGVPPQDVSTLVAASTRYEQIRCGGLMCIPDPNRAGGVGPAFQTLQTLEKSLHPVTRGILSMGMTADFAEAIAYGATDVRVGTAIFGSRN